MNSDPIMTLDGATFADLRQALATGRTTARTLVELSLDAISRDDRAFTRVDAEGARTAADASDRQRRAGGAPSPHEGIPISVKDLFDMAGQSTPAGAAILRQSLPAECDAPTIARLKAAGLIIIGRTQMSEFAFTGLGLNPHAPQPVNPKDPTRVPGGSSGGAAVSVGLGQAAGAIGTDTGGSVRIPAAFCGLTGFKPTQRRVTRAGAFPLSATLDSIGPIANSVGCCDDLDAILADEPRSSAPTRDLRTLCLGVPKHYLLEGMALPVANAWDRSLAALSRAGARIEGFDFPELERIAQINAKGTISNAEAYAFHRREGLLVRSEAYDPNVLARIRVGEDLSAADYLDLLAARTALIAQAAKRTAPFDAVICPTVPILAPRFDEVVTPQAFARKNALALRNPSVANLLDRCAISLPMVYEEAPCGLMLMGETLGDARLFAVAKAVEETLTAPL